MMSSFEHWWVNWGSGIPPKDGEDHEEHAKKVAALAWKAATAGAADTAYEACYIEVEDSIVCLHVKDAVLQKV